MADKDDDTIENGMAPAAILMNTMSRTFHGIVNAPKVVYGLKGEDDKKVLIEQGDALHDLRVQIDQGRAMGNNAALLSASGDPALLAEFFETVRQGLQSDGGLGWLAKKQAAGRSDDPQTWRDEVRLGLWGARVTQLKNQTTEDLFAAMEARDQAVAHAMPRYWSKNDQEQTLLGLNSYMDRQMLAAIKGTEKSREVSFVKMATVYNSLSNDAESLFAFARLEQERKRPGITAAELETLGDQQDSLVTNAQNVQKYPTVRSRAQNLGVSASAGIAFAWAGTDIWTRYGIHLGDWAEKLKDVHNQAVHSVGTLAAQAIDLGKEHLTAGLTIAGVTFMATQAARLGKFIGAQTTTLARLDEYAIKNSQKFTGMDKRLASWQQADFFMMTPYTHLSEHQLSDAQTQRFVEGLGYARAVVRAEAMGEAPPSVPSHWPKETQARFAGWTSHEFLGLASLKEPALANAYLFHTNGLDDRLATLDAQRRLSFLGALPAPMRFDDNLIRDARKVAEKNPTWANRNQLVAGTAYETSMRTQFDAMTPDVKRLLSFMPPKERLEAVARLGNHPLNPENPVMDMVRQVRDSTIEQCEKIETPGFAGRMAERFFVKKILGLEDGHLKGLQQSVTALWNARSNLKGLRPRQSFDFQHYDQELAAFSGAAGKPELLNRMESWVKQRTTAQVHFTADHPSASGPRTAPPKNLPSLDGLGVKLSLRDQAFNRDVEARAATLAEDKTFQKVARRNSWTR